MALTTILKCLYISNLAPLVKCKTSQHKRQHNATTISCPATKQKQNKQKPSRTTTITTTITTAITIAAPAKTIRSLFVV